MPKFQKGISGNPGGRPKQGLGEIRDIARQHTMLAINTLVEIAANGKKEHARVLAANALPDRGWGKPIIPFIYERHVTNLDEGRIINVLDGTVEYSERKDNGEENESKDAQYEQSP